MLLPILARIARHFLVQVVGILSSELIVEKRLLASQVRNKRVSANGTINSIGAETQGRILANRSAGGGAFQPHATTALDDERSWSFQGEVSQLER